MRGTVRVIEETEEISLPGDFLIGGGGGASTSDMYEFTETISELESRLDAGGVTQVTRERFTQLIDQVVEITCNYDIGTPERNRWETELGNKIRGILDGGKLDEQAANGLSSLLATLKEERVHRS